MKRERQIAVRDDETCGREEFVVLSILETRVVLWFWKRRRDMAKAMSIGGV